MPCETFTGVVITYLATQGGCWTKSSRDSVLSQTAQMGNITKLSIRIPVNMTDYNDVNKTQLVSPMHLPLCKMTPTLL